MLKKFFSILIMTFLIVGVSGNVFAKDTYTATSTINGVTANWEYELNETNQIENLKCTNPGDLTGNLTVPSTIGGKTVVSLKSESFKGANITELTIPNTIKSIGYESFSNCANLVKVNLGQLEKISFDVFKNCPKLTTITLPKTLIDGPGNVGGVFTGTTKLTSVNFENGLTQIPAGILRNCTSITKVTIPSSVKKINECAFQNSGLTEITIPSSVKEIKFEAFKDCTNLAKVNLGQLEEISFDVFKNCSKLATITIPKTLINGPGNVGGVFTGTTKLTSVTFENGLTQIPSGILRDCTSITKVTIPSSVTKINECAFQNSGLAEVTIPDSVKEISYNAFQDCSNLVKVNLGQLEKISFDVFKNCPKLTTITIPKTLINGVTNGVFTGTTKLTSVNFENGLTQIPAGLLKDCTNLTEVTIPDTVKEIGYNAFQNCSNLVKVNLGQLEKISFDVFKNCSKLTTITIPKTLINGPTNVGGVFTGTTKLTSVTFENGLTQIPAGILRDCTGITKVTIPSSVTKINECAFQNSGITEITISSAVNEINYYTFKDCAKLEKVTILNENAKMGWFSIKPTEDSVFENHNKNLTIYCYENSIAAKYAIANKIKYVYLTKNPTTDNNIDENKEQNQQQKPNNIDEDKVQNQQQKPNNTQISNQESPKKEDPTIAHGVIPQTGVETLSLFIILIISVFSIIFYIRYRKYRDIE